MDPDTNEIATVRIEIVDSDPLIWREVEVPISSTLKRLHDVIQGLFCWGDYHLWEFTIRGKTYGPPLDEEDDLPHQDAAKVRLRDVLSWPGHDHRLSLRFR